MSLFGLIRGTAERKFVPPPPPRESRYTLFLKLVSRHRAGGLDFSHHVTNPDERPDHVFRHDCRFRTFTQGDFETTRWTVTAVTPEEDAMLERATGKHPRENLVVLTDEAGNVLLHNFCTTEEATRAVATVERATKEFAAGQE